MQFYKEYNNLIMFNDFNINKDTNPNFDNFQ